MKIRLNSSSIRFRVSPAEIETLSQKGSLRETVRMGIQPGNRLSFEIHLIDVLEQMSFHHENGAIRILMPKTWLPQWQSQSKVGFEMKHGLGPHVSPIKIIVERDLE